MPISKILKEPAENISGLTESFDMVYMDPPFGLMRDFTMVEEDGTQKGFQDQWNSFDEYIEWYSEIIQSAWSKMAPNSWMYLHNNFEGNALVLGELPKSIRKCYYTNISWKRSGPKNNIKNGWGNIVDSIMVLRKGNPYFEVEYTDLDAKYEKNSFKNKDEKGFYALAKVSGEKSRPCRRFEYKGYNPTYGFRISEEMLAGLDADGRIHFGGNNLYKKIYLEESKGVPVQNLWDDVYFISRSEQNKRKYPTQKPLKLLERIIKSSCPVDGWVLDPFCGSGTTALASYALQRNCVTMDINPDALQLATEGIEELSGQGGLMSFFE
jgi:adenine-specific DNA-methyltransferase